MTQTEADTAPALVVEYIIPAPALSVHAALARTHEYVAHALVFTDLAFFLEPLVPVVQVVQDPQVQLIEEIVVIEEIQSAPGTQTSESLGTIPARQVTFSGILENGGGGVTSLCRTCPSDALDDTRGRCASCGCGARPS